MKTVKAYGCVKCQTQHYDGESLYEMHIGRQSKHGLRIADAKEAYDTILRRIRRQQCIDLDAPVLRDDTTSLEHFALLLQ